jgi:dipeptidyl aminopeptidase/acylaminoacyl peptidase
MPDARVQAAVEHWGPRFIQAGVDTNDFARTTARVERWEDWLGAWCSTASEHEALAREAEAAGRTVTAGEAWLRAAVCFHFGKFVWVVDEVRSRAAADRAVAALREAHRLLDPGAERIEAPLDGAAVIANLRRPRGASRPPLVLLVPGLDSTKEEFFLLENLFHARGMATLSLDGPGQGECALPLRPDYEVAVAATLDAVAGGDFGPVGALGVSLGGYYAPRAAAFEPRIRAVAGISGAFCFGELWDTLPELTRETFVYKSRAADDEDGRRRALELDLSGVLERLEAPALFVTGKLDRLIPWEQTRRQAEAAPRGEFVLFEDGNHVCANVPYKSRPLVADWLREQLAA